MGALLLYFNICVIPSDPSVLVWSGYIWVLDNCEQTPEAPSAGHQGGRSHDSHERPTE